MDFYNCSCPKCGKNIKLADIKQETKADNISDFLKELPDSSLCLGYECSACKHQGSITYEITHVA